MKGREEERKRRKGWSNKGRKEKKGGRRKGRKGGKETKRERTIKTKTS